MLFYYVVFALILVSFIPKEKFGKYIAWLAFGFMFLMTLFRAEDVGTDTINYLVYGTDHRANEFLCMWVVYLMETGVLSDYGMIYVLASVTYLFLLLNVLRFRIDIRYLVLFFFLSDFFVMGMNISRQVAAISLVSFFVPYVLAEQRSKRLLFFCRNHFRNGIAYLVYLWSCFVSSIALLKYKQRTECCAYLICNPSFVV